MGATALSARTGGKLLALTLPRKDRTQDAGFAALAIAE